MNEMSDEQTVSTPELSLDARCAHLEKRLAVSKGIDDIIEGCQAGQKNLAYTIELIFDFIENSLGPKAAFFRTQNEDLALSVFARGTKEETLESLIPDLLSTGEKRTKTVDGSAWFVMALDIAGETIGSFGLAYDEKESRKPEIVFDLMTAVAEEMDNFFYDIHRSRYKYLTILEIQRCLKSHLLNEAVDMAVNIIGDTIPLDKMVLFYIDEDLDGRKAVQYFIYQDYKKTYDSFDNPMPELEKLVRRGTECLLPGNKELEEIFPSQEMMETILLDGLVVETLVGKILFKPPKGIGLSVSSREIMKVFSESLRQRLVDFNREKNLLRQFFSPEVTRKLLKINNYKEAYLSPRKKDLGILFCDIAGFTKLSEQILVEPTRIAKFINSWSSGVTERLFLHNGALDKLVGDCVIGLFGLPFFDRKPEEIASDVLRAALVIREFTMEFLHSPENAEIQKSPMFADFGVTIGVNFCSCAVGLIGPNQDLTAFSSGMNNTARLQGVATRGEILATPAVMELAQKGDPGMWRFDGPHSAKVKNVKDPLPYYKLLNEKPIG